MVDDTSERRKMMPMVRGLLDYFPDALADVAFGSFVGNEKHNPGEELHHARGKSMDHADCIMRHLVQRGEWDIIQAKDGTMYRVRHSTWVAWRALALLQEEIEREQNLPLARGASYATSSHPIKVATVITPIGSETKKPVRARRPRKGKG